MKAVVYTRISLDRTSEGAGVERQLKACQELADRIGWTITQVYSDNDISAFSGKTRPEFEAMLHAMKQGHYEGLICWHTDRLHRNMRDLERLIEIADQQKMEIRTVQGGSIDLSTASGRMIARILGSVARQESEHLAERRRLANDQRAAKGEFVKTGQRRFGYTREGEPYPGEAEDFQKAVKEVLAGKSLRAVAREWNAKGYRSTARSAEYTPTSIRKILLNPRYAAIRVHRNKEVGKGNWTPLIDEETHNLLKMILTDPKRSSATSRERKHMGSNVYICGVCGEKLLYVPTRTLNSYRCKKNLCVRRTAESLDEYISEVMIDLLSQPNRPKLGDDVEDEIDISALRVKRDALKSRLTELASMFSAGDIDSEQLKAGTADLREQIAVIDEQLVEARNVSPIFHMAGSTGGDVRETWFSLSADLRGKIIQSMIEVRVHRTGKRGPGFDPKFIEIRPVS